MVDTKRSNCKLVPSKSRMSKIISVVHERLADLSNRPRQFDQDIRLYRLRIPVPLVRKSMKPAYAFVSSDSDKNLNAWDELWNKSDLFEAKSQAIYFYQYKSITLSEFKVIASWVDQCSCWEHSDDLSKVIASVTEENPDWTMPLLNRWVKSKNPWHRRQSLVGMIEYSSKRKRYLPFETYIKNIDALLLDKDYYVQKAVGWILREVYNVYPEKCLKYQIKNLSTISAIAYSAATEKLKSQDKAKLNKLRKQLRAKSISGALS